VKTFDDHKAAYMIQESPKGCFVVQRCAGATLSSYGTYEAADNAICKLAFADRKRDENERT
jgi:hypothetical protein